eukprot:m.461072 g.461072  ORF g.461072 m.461072 type:complete len:387 (+) comp22200_c0_seq1:158-1318(+)
MLRGTRLSALFTPALAERLAARPAGNEPTCSPVVGVCDAQTPAGLRFRVFYPGQPDSTAVPAGWFTESLGDALKGHVHTMSPMKSGTTSFALLAPLLKGVANTVIPLAHAALPTAFVDLVPQPPPPSGFPVVVFSHGLTGTGEEQATLFTAWARAGWVVAVVHHTEGSSSRAVLPGGNELYYQHPPGMNGRPGVYPPDYRTVQVERRQAELTSLVQYIVDDKGLGAKLPIENKRVVIGGFSYGAATAALAVAKHPERYAAAILLDGWFNIDLKSIKSCSSDEQVAFPPLAHERGLGSVPALFVGSSEFAGYRAMHKATEELSRKCGPGTETHVLPQTTHFSFMDMVCWLSVFAPWVYRKMGAHDPEGSYEQLFDLTTAFLSRISKL